MCMIFDVYIKVKKLNIRPEKRGGKKFLLLTFVQILKTDIALI